MFKHVLRAVEERLKEVEELRYISIDWGQAEEGMQAAVKYPCALIGLTETAFSHMNAEWRAETRMTVRVIATNLTNVSSEAPENQKKQYKRFCDIVERCAAVLHGYAAEDLQPLAVESIERIVREDKLWEYRIGIRANWSVKK